MNRWQPIWQMFLARLREFYREPEVIFWVYGFPVLLAVGLGIAFRSKEPEPPVVDVQQSAGFSASAAALLEQLQGAGVAAELHDEEACRQRLRTGKTALYVVPIQDGYRCVYDPARAESLLARVRVEVAIERLKTGTRMEPGGNGSPSDESDAVQRWKAGAVEWRTVDAVTREPGSRYIDFLMPGLMGMNIMGGGLWGVGFVIVDMRVRKLLKRLLATPMRRSDFLLAILGARLVFLMPEMLLLVLVGRFGFGVPLEGDVFTLILVIFVGAAAFSGIGLLVACRASKTETVSGLMNLVMLPMWLLSGTFFSSRQFPDVAQPFIQALPLTQLNDALREVMLEGAGLPGVSWRLAILAAWAVVSFLIALRAFRWN
ncbi:MAG TPA: ABC transporter permease [Gemmataceae bacterium]|nr:ABC transporter permease [Gemmataceae bacterium]